MGTIERVFSTIRASRMKKKALVVVAMLVLVAAMFAAYKVYDTHTTQLRVIALVKDATQRLRATLSAQAAGNSDTVVQAHFTATDAHVSALRNMKTASLTPLADAADDALVTSREIMRRQVAIDQARKRLATSFDTLARHIKSDRGRNDWTREAVQMKGAVDKDLRDYRMAVESYSMLLESFPASQAKVAPYVEPALLIDEKLLGNARQRALDAYADTDQTIKRISTLQAYRVNAGRKR
jgi:hypothetical protein